MINKKRICIATSALALGLMSGVSANAAETINFWFPTFASTDGEVTDEEFWNGVMDNFEEENDCEVNVTIVPWDNYEEKYMTGTIASDGPDVGYLYMEMFYDYIDNGMLADIDSYFTEEEKANYIYYDLGNLLGGQYALPVVVGNPRIFVANMDILNEAGITEVPNSIEELVDACEKIKESNPDVTPFMQAWGNPHYGEMNEIFWPFFWGEGGEIVDEEGNLTIDSAEGLAAAELLYSFKENGYLGENTTACDDSIEPFKNGEAAMVFMASSNALRIDTVNWDFSPVLSGSKDAQTFVAADCLVMFESCENKDLAAKLMSYVTSSDVMSQFHSQISEQPPITLDEEYEGDERYATLFTEYGDNFKSLPVFKSASSMYDQLFKNLQMMMLDQKTPQEVLTETTEYYNSNLS